MAGQAAAGDSNRESARRADRVVVRRRQAAGDRGLRPAWPSRSASRWRSCSGARARGLLRLHPAPRRATSRPRPGGSREAGATTAIGRLPAAGLRGPGHPLGQPCPVASKRFSAQQQIAAHLARGRRRRPARRSTGARSSRRPPAQVNGGPRSTPFNWAAVSRAYDAMLSAGITPIVLAYGAPRWARQNGWDRPGICRAAYGESASYPPGPPTHRRLARVHRGVGAPLPAHDGARDLERAQYPALLRADALARALLAAACSGPRGGARERRLGADPHRWAGGGRVRDKGGDPGAPSF